jgi:hypothetical protein
MSTPRLSKDGTHGVGDGHKYWKKKKAKNKM